MSNSLVSGSRQKAFLLFTFTGQGRLAAQQPIERKSAPTTQQQRCSHEKKCQGVFDTAVFSRATRQEKSVARVRFEHGDANEKGQTQGKGSREKPD